MKIKRVTLVARKEQKNTLNARATFREEMIKRFEYLGFNHTEEYDPSYSSNNVIEMALLRQAHRHYMEIIGLCFALSSVKKLTKDRQQYGDLIFNNRTPAYQEENLAVPFMRYRYRIPYFTCLLYVQYASW